MDDRGEISCRMISPEGRELPVEVDELSVRLLFSYFTHIRYEKRLEKASELSLASLAPERKLARLEVESATGERHVMEVFSMPGENGRESHMHRALVLHNEDPDPLIINYLYLDVLMRPLQRYYVDNG
jgi:hypothetical protein